VFPSDILKCSGAKLRKVNIHRNTTINKVRIVVKLSVKNNATIAKASCESIKGTTTIAIRFVYF
jgi:hypothetical protein